MAKTNKRQHFLARFYLRNFAEPLFGEQLCYFDIETQRWAPRTTKGVGWFPDLCSMLDMEGNRTDEFDRLIKRNVEDVAASALRKLALSEEIDDEERSIVALFIAITAARSPEMMRGVMSDHIDSLGAESRKELEAWVQVWCQRASQSFEDAGTHEFLKPSLLNAIWVWAQSLQQRLLEWKWHWLRTTRGQPFVTSDWPVSTFRDEDVRILNFPISSELALVIVDGGTINGACDPSGIVIDINRRTMSRATSFVVACKEFFPGDEFLPKSRQ